MLSLYYLYTMNTLPQIGDIRKYIYISDGQKRYLKTLGIRQIVPTEFSKFKGQFAEKKSANCPSRSAN